MISLKQINYHRVKKIHIPKRDTRPIRGFDICEELYANIFLCARKKSGKTSALFKIMKECIGRKTKIYVFCSTAYKDPNWIQIRKYFENKGLEINVFTSIYEDNEDQLLKLVNQLNDEAKDEEDAEIAKEYGEGKEEKRVDVCDQIMEKLRKHYLYGTGQEKVPEINEDAQEYQPKEKKKKSRFQSPEYMLIFDDLSSELKSPSLLTLMKWNRHYKSKLIISSQWLHDLLPESRKQIDVFLIFKGFPEKKLEIIYKDCDSSVPFEIFYRIYKKSTKHPFSFMYIDTRSDKFRCNFDKEFIIKDNSENDEN